ATRALAALREFVEHTLPVCDEALPETRCAREPVLPRVLRSAGAVWHAGTAVSPGIGQGTVVLARGLALTEELARERAASIEHEDQRIRVALAAVRSRLEAKLAARPAATEAGILRAHLSIAKDLGLTEKLAALVVEGRSAGQAVVEAARYFAATLENAESIY